MNLQAASLFFHVGQSQDAEDLVLQYHYSERTPSNVQVVGTLHESGGLFVDMGRCVAACFFSIPPTRWGEDVLELSRLVRVDGMKLPLSMLVSKTAKQAFKKCDLLVSFADWTHNHHGGIYQACSWNYDGMREPRMDGVVVDGVFVPGRSANSAYGTRSPTKLREQMPRAEIEPHMDAGKHLYWRANGKAGMAKAQRLGLSCRPYPKPTGIKP